MPNCLNVNTHVVKSLGIGTCDDHEIMCHRCWDVNSERRSYFCNPCKLEIKEEERQRLEKERHQEIMKSIGELNRKLEDIKRQQRGY